MGNTFAATNFNLAFGSQLVVSSLIVASVFYLSDKAVFEKDPLTNRSRFEDLPYSDTPWVRLLVMTLQAALGILIARVVRYST